MPRANVLLHRAAPELGAVRWPAPDDVAGFVLWGWSSWWRLPDGDRREVRLLTDTSVHVVIERDKAEVVGVCTRAFARRLEGEGRVLALKLLPGALRPIARLPMRALVDRRTPLIDVLGRDVAPPAAALVAPGAPEHDEARAAFVADFARTLTPPRDDGVALVQSLLERIEAAPARFTVASLAEEAGLRVRALQRLFGDVLGVSPKWVLRRHRLLDAAAALRAGRAGTVAALAADLGYFDEAHFARDFKAVLGEAPARFARSHSTRNAVPG